MERNNPLDFMITLTENVQEDNPLFGESSVGEVTLPEAENDADIDSMEFNFGDEESSETPGEEALEHSDEPRDVISELKRKLSELKEEITEKLKPLFPEDKELDKELAEALDDATSALDLCDHHLSDIDNKLSEGGSEDEEGEKPVEELEDKSMPSEEGAELPASEPLEGLE